MKSASALVLREIGMTNLVNFDEDDLIRSCEIDFMTRTDQSCDLFDDVFPLQGIVRSCLIANCVLLWAAVSITHACGIAIVRLLRAYRRTLVLTVWGLVIYPCELKVF